MRSLSTVAVLIMMTVATALPCAAQDREQPIWTLNRPCLIADYGGNKICMTDKAGKIIWQMKAARPQDVWMLPNGNVLFTHVKGVKEVDIKDNSVAWEYKTEGRNEIHACQPLANGVVMIAESGPMRIIEVNREMKIVHDVKLNIKKKGTHGQMRKVRKTKAGTYIVGQYSDAVVREYDGDGKVLRDYKQKNAFGASLLANGNLLLSTGDAHTITEIDKDDKVIWEVTEKELPNNPLRFIAGVQRLPNGNTLVCNWGGHGHVGKQPQIFEVTKDKKVVGELYDFKRFNTISGVCALDVKGDPTKFEIDR